MYSKQQSLSGKEKIENVSRELFIQIMHTVFHLKKDKDYHILATYSNIVQDKLVHLEMLESQ